MSVESRCRNNSSSTFLPCRRCACLLSFFVLGCFELTFVLCDLLLPATLAVLTFSWRAVVEICVVVQVAFSRWRVGLMAVSYVLVGFGNDVLKRRLFLGSLRNCVSLVFRDDFSTFFICILQLVAFSFSRRLFARFPM